MKYLMLDTNIYIDMVVSRNRSHKAESYDQLKKLLDYSEIKLIVPRIVITEVFRHIDNEIDKIGEHVKNVKNSADDLYWINHGEALEIFNKILKETKSSLNSLKDEYASSSDNYKKIYKEFFNQIFDNENCIILDENQHITFKAMQRSLYKKRPFHYEDKDKLKDSMADAIIIETLININDLININKEDNIYFISRNTKDFSDNYIDDLFHMDILRDLEAKHINDKIKYSTLFSKTLLEEFKDELDSSGLTEIYEEEAKYERRLQVEQSYKLLDDFERESVGLLSLSADYEEVIAGTNDIINFMNLFEEMKNEILEYCNDYNDSYYSLESMINETSLEELQNILNDNRLLVEIIDASKNENCIREKIIDLINLKIGGEDYASFGEEFVYDDYFSINNTLVTFKDEKNNEYNLKTEGYLNPSSGESDYISIYLYNGDISIAEGDIEIYYGYINYNEDGNVSDGAKQRIELNITNILSRLTEIKDEIICSLNNKILKLDGLKYFLEGLVKDYSNIQKNYV